MFPQHTATHCNTLQHIATHCNTRSSSVFVMFPCPASAAFFHNTLQHTATHGNTLQHTATNSNAQQHTATHSNTQQHTATHCNTLQHTATHIHALFSLWHRLHSSTTHLAANSRTQRCNTCTSHSHSLTLCNTRCKILYNTHRNSHCNSLLIVTC